MWWMSTGEAGEEFSIPCVSDGNLMLTPEKRSVMFNSGAEAWQSGSRMTERERTAFVIERWVSKIVEMQSV